MGVPIEKKRNFALIGHGGAGKTMLGEAAMFIAGATKRMGTIEDGNTVSDFAPEEIRRGYSINSVALPFDYEGHRLTMIDCPGYLDFIGETISSLSAVDSAVIVVDGGAGVEPQTRQAWKLCEKLGLSRMIFISGLDKDNSSWEKTLKACQLAFGRSVAPMLITIGEQHELKGVINLLTRRAYVKEGGKINEQDIPAEMQASVDEARAQLVESIVEMDDALMERYMEDEAIGDVELEQALLAATGRGDFCPVIGGAGKEQIGVLNMLKLIIAALPNPGLRGQVKGEKPGGGEESRALAEDAPFCARVFKVSSEGQLGELFWMRVYSGVMRPGESVYNANLSESEKLSTLLVMRGKVREDLTQAAAGDIIATAKLKYTKIGHTLSIRDNQIVLPAITYPSAVAYESVDVDDKNDLEKAMAALNTYAQMDTTLRVVQDEETKEQVVYGMGQLHLDIANAYVKSKTGVTIKWVKPRVPYRETITAQASAQGKFKKQTGGRGKYGDVHLRLDPLERGAGFEFKNEIVGGVVPTRFLPAVEKGVIETMNNGPLSGSRVIDVSAAAFYGSHHAVDSDELSFKVAGSMAFKMAFEQGSPIILEPIYDVTVWMPEDYMGDVMADMNTRRGRVGGMDQDGDLKKINAQVPLAELYQYINTLRSMTQGQGFYAMEFDHYEQVPRDVQQAIIKAHKSKQQDGG